MVLCIDTEYACQEMACIEAFFSINCIIVWQIKLISVGGSLFITFQSKAGL